MPSARVARRVVFADAAGEVARGVRLPELSWVWEMKEEAEESGLETLEADSEGAIEGARR